MASVQKRIGKQSLRDKPLKVFIDSSVLIAAAISPTGSARKLITRALRSEVTLVISDFVIEETQRNLTKKAPQALPALQLFLEALNPQVVSPTKTAVRTVSKTVEAKDAPIAAAALKAKADYLVSFDRKHLLQQKDVIKTNLKIKVTTPDEVK